MARERDSAVRDGFGHGEIASLIEAVCRPQAGVAKLGRGRLEMQTLRVMHLAIDPRPMQMGVELVAVSAGVCEKVIISIRLIVL